MLPGICANFCLVFPLLSINVSLVAWLDFLPEAVREHLEGPIGIVVLVVLGLLGVYLLAVVASKFWGLFPKKPVASPEDKLREKLAEYPPAPGAPGRKRLVVEEYPVRVRLVVVAPVGRENPIDAAEVETLLGGVVRGLSEIIEKDRPRVRVWPAQLSSQGFAATFHRLTEKPEPEGHPSQWILVAGPASAGKRPILLGLAMWADEPTTLGRLTIDKGRWTESLRVQTVEEE